MHYCTLLSSNCLVQTQPLTCDSRTGGYDTPHFTEPEGSLSC